MTVQRLLESAAGECIVERVFHQTSICVAKDEQTLNRSAIAHCSSAVWRCNFGVRLSVAPHYTGSVQKEVPLPILLSIVALYGRRLTAHFSPQVGSVLKKFHCPSLPSNVVV